MAMVRGRTRFESQTSVLSQPDLLSPEELFSQYTVDEIQRNHKKIQRDIESKKGELRAMVGERYRELINTADTIAQMEQTVQSIQTTLDNVHRSCKLERLSSCEAEEEAHVRKEEFWSLASQMKLLVDTPERIWRAMEEQNYLIASQLYLLSRHIVTNLHIGTSAHLTKFPVLAQQWGAISHFKSSILQGCREMLGGVKLTDDQFVDCLCSILLLEGSSLSSLLEETLEHRYQTIVSVMERGGSVRNQLSDCVEAITVTLELLNRNIVTENRVAAKVTELCKNVSTMAVMREAFAEEASLQSVVRHLPSLVTCYHPSLGSDLGPGPTRTLAVDWVARVRAAVEALLGSTLRHVQSVSSVTNLTKSYIQHSASAEWREVCEVVLGAELDVWRDVLLGPVNEHVKSIISTYLRDAILSTTRDIDEVVSQGGHERLDWSVGSVRVEQLQQKADGYGDSVKQLCLDLNDRMTAIQEDIVTYAGSPEKVRYKESRVRAEEVFQHVHSEVQDCLNRVAEHISSVTPEDVSEPGYPGRLAVLIQICRCLVVSTPKLHGLILSRDKYVSSGQLYGCVNTAKAGVLERYGSWMVARAVEYLGHSLRAAPIISSVVWEEIEIKERGAEGQEIESRVSLPIYCSTFVTGLLSGISSELYAAGCHGYTDGEVPAILGGLVERVSEVYEEWLEEHPLLTQNTALQYWLDYRYLTALTNVTLTLTTERTKKVAQVARRLEASIDPFDWDVFQPHLSANLHSLIRRTHCLYGAIAAHSTTVQAITSNTTKAPFNQNAHNVLVSNEMVSRFPLLPVTTDSSDDVTSTGHVTLPNAELDALCSVLKFFSVPDLL